MKNERVGKTIAFLFVLLAIGIIVFFTLQNSQRSAILSDEVRLWLADRLVKLGVSEEKVSGFWWNEYKNFRRVAHSGEFFLLGVTVALWVRKLTDKKSRWVWIIWTIVICSMLSLGDQMLKTMNPGREFDWIDLIFDAFGYFAGTASMLSLIVIRNVKSKEQ